MHTVIVDLQLWILLFVIIIIIMIMTKVYKACTFLSLLVQSINWISCDWSRLKLRNFVVLSQQLVIKKNHVSRQSIIIILNYWVVILHEISVLHVLLLSKIMQGHSVFTYTLIIFICFLSDESRDSSVITIVKFLSASLRIYKLN